MPGYWLFKSEPDEFSIDDLASAPQQRVRWDGIRNYQARNLLRDQVAPGDLVFFYHSSCRIPGIAGLAKVVSAPYPDPSQFDPESPYFDPKAKEGSPRWYSVDIELVKPLASVVPAKALKQVPELADMTLFRQGRLSVQPVSQQESDYLLKHYFSTQE